MQESGGRRSRALLGEFMVVMLGVLAALALEQLVLDWQERDRARATLLATNGELADYRLVFDLRLEAGACVVRKLDALDEVLVDSPESGTLENIGRTPYFFSSRGSWSASAADLVARHRGPELVLAYGEIYQAMEEFSRLAQYEQEHWARLSTLEGHSGPIDEDRRWRLAESIAAARNANLLLTAIAEQMIARIDSLDIAESQVPLLDVQSRPLCQPLRVNT